MSQAMEQLASAIAQWKKFHRTDTERDVEKDNPSQAREEEELVIKGNRSGQVVELAADFNDQNLELLGSKDQKGFVNDDGEHDVHTAGILRSVSASSHGSPKQRSKHHRHRQIEYRVEGEKDQQEADDEGDKEADDDNLLAKDVNSAAETGWNPNDASVSGESLLLLMVRENRASVVLSLLTAGADVNYRNDKGVSALDEAIKTCNPDLVEMLIAFGAEVRSPSALHLAADPNRTKILRLLREMNKTHDRRSQGFSGQMLRLMEEDKGTPAHQQSSKGDKVLCLDGGGIRGLVTIVMLRDLEKAIERPVRECFDVIGGTSIGGILALAIAKGLSLNECQDILLQLKTKIFRGSRTYNSGTFEDYLKKIFGANTKMSDIKGPRVIVTAVKADVRPPELYLFRNYETERLEDDFKAENMLVWQVARATSAAPSYFHPYEQFLDGGLLANNPTLDILRVVHNSKDRPTKLMVSMGTGSTPPKAATVPALPGGGLPSMIFNPTDYAQFIEMVLTSLTMSNGLPEQRASGVCKALNIPYFRFEPQLTEDVDLDCTDNRKIKHMMREAQKYIRAVEHDERFALLKQLLDQK